MFRRAVNLHDQLSGLFWLAISIFVCMQSIWNDIGTFHSPGPGFLPFWSGVALGTFSIILIVKSILEKKGQRKMTNLWKGIEWSNVILVLFSLLIYATFLNRIGYLIMTFGVMAFLFGLKRGSRLWIQVVSGLIISVVTYVIFYVWLGVQLPKGIFSF